MLSRLRAENKKSMDHMQNLIWFGGVMEKLNANANVNLKEKTFTT